MRYETTPHRLTSALGRLLLGALSGGSIPSQGDSTAIFQNAAGVSGLEHGEAYMMYNKLYAGQAGIDAIGQSFVTAGAPTRYGAIGVGLSVFKAAGLLNERVLGVSFSRRLFQNLAAGMTAKCLYHKYVPGSDQSGVGDPVFANGTSRYDKADWHLKTTADVVYRDNYEGTLRDRASPSLGLEKGMGDERVKFRVGANAGAHLIGIRSRFGGK